MREKIFDKMRENKLVEGYVWRFQQYYGVFAIHMNNVERKEFYDEMKKLCDEGIIEELPNGSTPLYRLTAKGEKILYR